MCRKRHSKDPEVDQDNDGRKANKLQVATNKLSESLRNAQVNVHKTLRIKIIKFYTYFYFSFPKTCESSFKHIIYSWQCIMLPMRVR